MGRPPSTEPKSLPVSLRLPPKVKPRLAAKEDLRSLSSYLEKLLTDHLRKQGFLKKWMMLHGGDSHSHNDVDRQISQKTDSQSQLTGERKGYDRAAGARLVALKAGPEWKRKSSLLD